MRRGGEHGEAPLRQGVMGSRQRLPADPRRVRLRRRVRRGKEVQGKPPVPRGADLHQPDPLLPRRARARPAAFLLSDQKQSALASALSPFERGAEIIFGILMAISVTAAAEITAGKAIDTRELMI